MKIDRIHLTDSLESFALRGNGVVVGDPGVGKTHLLLKLRQRLKAKGIPHLFLPIDQLGGGTQDELRAELSYQGDLIEKLRIELPHSDHQPGILLFDAFDAARSEQKQKRFLGLIRRAVRELRGLWNVVVAVRTYDAKRSQELLDLFDESSGLETREYSDNSIPCRHFKVPLLTEHEVEQAVNQIPSGKDAYERGSQDFKELLRIPFNSWLLERILSAPAELPHLSDVSSQVQLLRLFWDRRVRATSDGDEREIVLARVTRKMVEERSLSTRKENVYSPQTQEAWRGLFSEGLLEEASSSGQHVAYSHNILFDFAVSFLLIEDEPRELEKFLSEDPSRPLFLRPSLTYYFTRLWYDASDIFWRVFWHILPSRDPRLHLFARLIPPAVVANEARRLQQLTPLLESLSREERVANEAVLRILQALRSLQIQNDELWVLFLDEVDTHLHREFAWDLATITSEILRRKDETGNDTILRACGRVGRSLLRWIWQEREQTRDAWINNLGAVHAVPLVAETFQTDSEESRVLLGKVLALTSEENFPIDFLYRLADEVDKIWPHDPQLVASVYETVFSHFETSEEKTHMGGIVLPLSSNRRQDYDMCRYILVRHFPDFLRAAPPTATRAAIVSLNSFIVAEHIARYLYEDVKFEDLPKEFRFRGEVAHYVPDGSYIWDVQYEGHYDKEPAEMASALFEFMGELASSEARLTDLDLLLDVLRDNVWVAFFWRRLLRAAAQVPEIFAPRLFELCIASPMTESDTLWELGEFLEAAAPYFTDPQLAEIERTLVGLPGSEEDVEQREFLEHRRDRLLARISPELLRTKEARELRNAMEEGNEILENRPLITLRSWSEPYSETRFLQRQGVDTAHPENQRLLNFESLERFRSEWLNGVPTLEAVRSVLPDAKELYSLLQCRSGADEAVADAAWSRLAASVAVMSRTDTDADSDVFRFCREVLLLCSKHASPEPDPQHDREYNFPTWSPLPRNEAAEGLPWLASRRADGEILEAVAALVRDEVPSVRYLAVRELFRLSGTDSDSLWRLVEYVTEHETNRVVLQSLCHTLVQVIAQEEEKTVKVLDQLLEKALSLNEKSDFQDSLIDLSVWLVLVRANEWAANAITSLLSDPVRLAKPLRRAVLEMSRFLTPQLVTSPEGSEIAGRAIDWQSKAIAAAAGGVSALRASLALSEHHDEETLAKLRDVYRVIDEVITRLYFAADVNENLRDGKEYLVSDEQRERFYFKVKPLLDQVLTFARDNENGVLLAPTAHHFMELLNGVLKYDPKGVLHMAAGVAISSRSAGYNFDSLAIREVVNLVEAILADYRAEVREGRSLQDLLDLLDIFAETGWPDALHLVWRLDEVFR